MSEIDVSKISTSNSSLDLTIQTGNNNGSIVYSTNGIVTANVTAVVVGNSTVNSVVNSTAVAVGANVVITPTQIKVGNSTVNTSVNSTGFGINGTLLSSGSIVLLNTLNIVNTANVTDTTSISNTYSAYFLSFNQIVPTINSATFQVLSSNDAGVSFGGGLISSLTSESGGATVTQSLNFVGLVSNTAGSLGFSGYVNMFYDYNGGLVGVGSFFLKDSAGALRTYNSGFLYQNTAISQIRFRYTSGNIATGTIKIYGIK